MDQCRSVRLTNQGDVCRFGVERQRSHDQIHLLLSLFCLLSPNFQGFASEEGLIYYENVYRLEVDWHRLAPLSCNWNHLGHVLNFPLLR